MHPALLAVPWRGTIHWRVSSRQQNVPQRFSCLALVLQSGWARTFPRWTNTGLKRARMDNRLATSPEGLGRILVVDDNRDNVEIIATRLRFRGYEIDEASDGMAALALVHSNPPDLILLDVMLPDIDGYEISRRIKGDDKLPFIPIILVTARDTTQDKVAGLDAGADDYLTKPIDFPELEARVRSMLRIKKLQDEIERQNRELERLSISDGLTGLFNHRHIHTLLNEEFERADRTGERITVSMFDLDRF